MRVSNKQDRESNGVGKVVENPQLCGWVPPQCCLIPLPESPGPSDDEREGEEGGEREAAASGPLSESELQRQHERELEVLFGFKPAPSLPPPSAEDRGPPMSEEKGGVKKDRNIEGDVFDENKETMQPVVIGNIPKARSNSADSGVVSISPHSSEGDDMEQRPIQNQTVVSVTSEEHKIAISTKNTQPTPAETSTDDARTKLECVASEQGGGGGEINSTPEKPSQRPCLPVSRLRTPSEKLQKCSIFTGSVSLICLLF